MHKPTSLQSLDQIQSFFKDSYPVQTRLLVVTGKKSFEMIESKFRIKESLRACETTYCNEFSSNPSWQEVLDAVEGLKDKSFDEVLAIGGGSVIDFAKLLSFHLPDSVINIGKARFTAIPTTAGTGSEATQFATYYEGGIKKSLDDLSVLPKRVALMPPALEMLPLQVARNTCADALCQAIESFWNIKSTDESSAFAVKAIELILASGVEYVSKRTLQSCERVSLASYYAGKAINITRTTAPHSISYPMTSRFDIPHGQAVSLSLVPVFEFNAGLCEDDCNDSRGSKYVLSRMTALQELLGESDVKRAAQKLEKFFLELGLKLRLSDLNMDEDSIEVVLREGFTPQRMNNNPRKISEPQLKSILQSIL